MEMKDPYVKMENEREIERRNERHVSEKEEEKSRKKRAITHHHKHKDFSRLLLLHDQMCSNDETGMA